MPTKTLYIHIGTHKTGTSAIQNVLSSHHKELLKYGIYYPVSGREKLPTQSKNMRNGHHNIQAEIRGIQKIDALKQLRKELKQSQYPIAIISAEGLSKAEPDQIRLFANYLDNFDVKVIVYLRRQDQYLQSHWAQYVKNGYVDLPATEWFNILEHTPSITNPEIGRMINLNYESLVDDWANVFGENNIVLGVYEHQQLKNGILVDLLNRIDGEADFTGLNIVEQEINITPSIKTLEYIRNFQIFLNKNSTTQQKIAPIFYRKMRDRAEELGWNTEKINLIDRARYERLMSIYGAGNQRLAQKYLNREQLFFEPFQDKPITTFSVEDFTSEEMFDVASHGISILAQERKEVSQKMSLNWILKILRR